MTSINRISGVVRRSRPRPSVTATAQFEVPEATTPNTESVWNIWNLWKWPTASVTELSQEDTRTQFRIPEHDNQSIVSVQSNGMVDATSLVTNEMSALQMFERLVEHGCPDLTSTVDPEQYSSNMLMGGGFGDIWKGKLKNGTDVAIKVWRFALTPEDGGKTLKRAVRELYNWSKMSHKNIHKLLGVIVFRGQLGMVSRWMDHGHLREYIYKNKTVDRYQLCIQVAEGVNYLHDKNMVHGDLKACNILVSLDGVAKITDFDQSIISDCSLLFSATSQMGGTLRWMAPELVMDPETTNQRSKRTDIYALGMTFFEIVTGTIPYFPECRIDYQIFTKLSRKELPKQTMDFTRNERGERMWALLVQCWDHNPAARPMAYYVLDELQHLVEETVPSTTTA